MFFLDGFSNVVSDMLSGKLSSCWGELWARLICRCLVGRLGCLFKGFHGDFFFLLEAFEVRANACLQTGGKGVCS